MWGQPPPAVHRAQLDPGIKPCRNIDIEPLPSLNYYRRIFSAYLLGGKSHLTFWHETPAQNPNATARDLGEYYMLFSEKADYNGVYDSNGVPQLDSNGVPQLDYHGKIGSQYNPIAIAQYGLGNYNLFRRHAETVRREKMFRVAVDLAGGKRCFT